MKLTKGKLIAAFGAAALAGGIAISCSGDAASYAKDAQSYVKNAVARIENATPSYKYDAVCQTPDDGAELTGTIKSSTPAIMTFKNGTLVIKGIAKMTTTFKGLPVDSTCQLKPLKK